MPRNPATSRPYDINLVSLRMAHHASASGYDRLAGYIDADVIHAPHELGYLQRAVGKLLKSRIRNSGLLWYQRQCLMAELEVAGRWLRKGNQVFHFLYGENLFRYTGALRRIRRRNAIVCTYHTPPERFREVVSDPRFIGAADAVIVVSRIQQQVFEQYLPKERVFFVPHGIDTGYFSPPVAAKPAGKEHIRCIAVGSHLRDLAALAAAARLVAEAEPGIRFDVVTRENLFFHFSGLPNVDLHAAVTDEMLLFMYRRADLMVLPLLDATANNSLLEAMGCGLPIVTTDLPGVRDYVDAQCAVLVGTGDANALAASVLELGGNRARRDALGAASRCRALEFAWPRIAEMTLEVYDAARARS